MNKVVYGNNLASYFYIQRIGNQLLVISIGSDNPFEYIGVLFDAIHKHPEHINSAVVEIYFDLLSCVGNNESRFSKLTYDKNIPNSVIDNFVSIDSSILPNSILKCLKKFSSKHFDEALLYSILSNREKNRLTASSII
ncbi:MAG: type II toxin-antitoxin system RnlB family antitoxin [Nitrospirae bacterium]|nr:type II toxin-antitoxin system RnlB family antitoxin [Nitrospirota bacterium]